jgi:hypothetical protein
MKKNERREQLIKEKLGGDIEVLLFGKSEGTSPSISAPILQGVQAMALPAAGGDFLSQESSFNPDKFILG